MRQKFMKPVMVLAMAMLILTTAFVVALPVQAVTTGWGDAANSADEAGIASTIELGNKDPRAMVASVINVLLSFLGIIAVVIILIGGFKWMTAGGNEEKTGEAKKLITAGVIGLVIILASWAIATFVLNQLIAATI